MDDGGNGTERTPATGASNVAVNRIERGLKRVSLFWPQRKAPPKRGSLRYCLQAWYSFPLLSVSHPLLQTAMAHSLCLRIRLRCSSSIALGLFDILRVQSTLQSLTRNEFPARLHVALDNDRQIRIQELLHSAVTITHVVQ